MVTWYPVPLALPESAPEEIRLACTGWQRTEADRAKLRVENVSFGLNDRSSGIANEDKVDQLPRAPQRRELIASILENIFEERASDSASYQASTCQPTPDESEPQQAPEEQPGNSNKRLRIEDETLDQVLARLYPPAEPFHVRVRFGTRSDEWKPAIPPTQRYHPDMKQPLHRPTRWNDYGVIAKAKGKVPHESVLDFLVDVMRNKHWRGTITNTISSIPTENLDPFPRTHYSYITRIIAGNPFLLRLAQIMEGRFFEATARNMKYVPAVVVHGETNRNAPLEPHYVAAILVQALGRENAFPCSLCAGDWNAPGDASQLANSLDQDLRPFKKCVSLYSLALPPRFGACGNHFWLASIADCACVNLTAPVHPDERYEYIFDVFSPNAANYMFVKTLLKDEFLQVTPAIPEGFVALGPFFVRNDVVRNAGLLKYGADLLVALAQFQYDRGQEVDDNVPETGLGKELRDKLARM